MSAAVLDYNLESRPAIYGFLNGGSPQWWSVMAISEDGHALAGHLCSSAGFFLGDLGFTHDWSGKREKYEAHYPDGYRLVWVERDDIAGHEGLQAAFALGNAMKEAEEAPNADART